MLTVFYSRENTDKAKFIFDNIGTESLILVPDQFTLEAEKEAIDCLGAEGLMDVEVCGMARLGFRVLSEVGGLKKNIIDKYGRHMILSKILMEAETRGDLLAYSGIADKSTFIDMVNDLICEMKQHGATPAVLAKARVDMDEESLIARKLTDIEKIFDAYEEAIKGKFTDSEDYIDYFLPKLGMAKSVAGKEIWVWGFDYFPPKNVEILATLMKFSNVNLVMSYDEGGRDEEVFRLTGSVIERLEERAVREGVCFQRHKIGEEYKIAAEVEAKAPALAFLEKEIYSMPTEQYQGADDGTVTLVQAANYYSEAETAAAYATELIRDKGLRLRDILIICNDTEIRGAIVKRVFAEYGMEVFADKKRGIMHNHVIVYVTALMGAVMKNYRSKDIIRLLKTGLTGISHQRVEDIENYAIKYRIRGNMWKAPFYKGEAEYGEYFHKIEATRAEIIENIEAFEKTFKESKKAKDRVAAMYRYLRDIAMLPEKIEEFIDKTEEQSLFEGAQETAQAWNTIVSILEQIAEIFEEENISLEMFESVFMAGLEAVEIGVLPPTIDGLMMGTMQRTRAGNVEALVVIGANEGVLPAEISSESLLSEDEKLKLFEKDIYLCKPDEIRAKEERFAIYKNFAGPKKYLWVGCSLSDNEGKETKPSMIFNTLREIYPHVQIKTDIVSCGDADALIQTPASTLRHIIDAVRDNKVDDKKWLAAAEWYKKQSGGSFEKAMSGFCYRVGENSLGAALAEKLYRKEGKEALIVSPSRLEKFSRCPFSHFISYGLRPEERRVFEAAGREIGELYHLCLMELSEKLSSGTDVMELWLSVTREQCNTIVADILLKYGPSYREGIFLSGKEEEYRYSRMREILCVAAWGLVEHIRVGRVKSIKLEERFAVGKKIPPIVVDTSAGKIFIEGIIDRMDILEGDTVKIIDYKSGKESFDEEEAAAGWKLQLMLYMKAALGHQFGGSKPAPAGMYYFVIKEHEIKGDGIKAESIKDKVKEKIKMGLRLNGIIVDHPCVIENTAGEFGRYSDIVESLSKKKDEDSAEGFVYDGKAYMSDRDFDEFMERFDAKLSEICNDLSKGVISPAPKKTDSVSACVYCDYKGICKFDLAFEGCKYENI